MSGWAWLAIGVATWALIIEFAVAWARDNKDAGHRVDQVWRDHREVHDYAGTPNHCKTHDSYGCPRIDLPPEGDR